MSLREQTATLFTIVHNSPLGLAHNLTGKSESFIGRMSKANDECRRMDVVAQEKTIKFGETPPGTGELFDCGADDVDLAKQIDPDAVDKNQNTVWEQWGGLCQRGICKSLMLWRLNPMTTSTRAPGPGAMRTTDWQAKAERHMKNRNCVLHTDGARAYKLKVEGMLHDHVVHRKTQLKRNGVVVKCNGKPVWLKPKYTKTFTHKTFQRKTVKCKGGTQIIDRFWQHLRRFLKCRSHDVGSLAMNTRIRSAQWAYWHRDEDLWLETGAMLKRLSKP